MNKHCNRDWNRTNKNDNSEVKTFKILIIKTSSGIEIST